MFNWITTPQVFWTPIDSLLCIIEVLIIGWLLIKIAMLICKIIDFFNKED